jgi:hypothetical protein
MTAEDMIDALWYPALRGVQGLWEESDRLAAAGREAEAENARGNAEGMLALIGMIDAEDGPPQSLAALIVRGRNVLEARARAVVGLADLP